MYGAATELVICFKRTGKVNRFALDPSLGEFVHTDSDIKFPEGVLLTKGIHNHDATRVLPFVVHVSRSQPSFLIDGGKKIYSCNEGNSVNWDNAIKGSVEYFKQNK